MSISQEWVAGRYRLVEQLGAGGMGRVWRARDDVLHRDVAIKEVVPPEGLTEAEREELRQRTVREARAAARLNDPHVVRIYDAFYAEARPWIVMEYVPSRSLYQVMTEDEPLEPDRVAQIGLAVLRALKAAHEAGVLHRDVKPGNVLLADDGRVVLTDFGLATFEGGDGSLTRPGLILGSAEYISPERADDGVSGLEGDLWSLGATLYAALEGQSPFARSTTFGTLTALATEDPDPPYRAGSLEPVLKALLRKDPGARPSIAETERLLQRAAASEGRAWLGAGPRQDRPRAGGKGTVGSGAGAGSGDGGDSPAAGTGPAAPAASAGPAGADAVSGAGAAETADVVFSAGSASVGTESGSEISSLPLVPRVARAGDVGGDTAVLVGSPVPPMSTLPSGGPGADGDDRLARGPRRRGVVVATAVIAALVVTALLVNLLPGGGSDADSRTLADIPGPGASTAPVPSGTVSEPTSGAASPTSPAAKARGPNQALSTSPPSPTPANLPPAGGRDAYGTIQAESYDQQSGTTLETTSDIGGGRDITSIANGDWVFYQGVNFGSATATQFVVRVASGAAVGVSGLVEIRLDSLSSTPIGSCALASTGGWQTWVTVPANIGPVTGTHNVYITFSSTQRVDWLNVNWLTFGR